MTFITSLNEMVTTADGDKKWIVSRKHIFLCFKIISKQQLLILLESRFPAL